MKRIKRIILFRFHKEFAVCKNRLELLRLFNPHIPIYGLYGGLQKDYKDAKRLPLIRRAWNIPLDDSHWKWVNGDLCIRWWYKDFGRNIDFDVLHVVEWDLVLLKSVEEQFGHIQDGVAITGVIPMAKIYDTWDWVMPRRGREEWLQLKKIVEENYGYHNKPLVGVFGGAALSKKFLERYSKIEVPSLCNDEVRVPLFAQIFHMPVYDTKLRSKFFTALGRKEFSSSIVYRERKKGVTVFHPVKDVLRLDRILKKP